MDVHQKVRSALREQLLTAVTADDVAWENRVFEAKGRTFYVRESLKHGPSKKGSLGPNARVRHRGTWFLDVFTKIGEGTKEGDQRASELMAAFPPTLSMIYGGQTTVIEESSRQGARREGDWHMTPVQINWYADTFNSI